ncbi:hypothetical protein KM043_017837 [Ampulex compressa]|nr:hypothetical protein KM043_017837 [Ampulex compressa]
MSSAHLKAGRKQRLSEPRNSNDTNPFLHLQSSPFLEPGSSRKGRIQVEPSMLAGHTLVQRELRAGSRGLLKRRTTAVCLRPMTLRPHEDAMHCNAMQLGAGASGRASSGSVGARGAPGDPRSPSLCEQTDGAHRFAQPANLYQRQKYFLAQDSPAYISDDVWLHPEARLTRVRLVDLLHRWFIVPLARKGVPAIDLSPDNRASYEMSSEST